MGLAEIAIREQCGLLAYSPMAFGMLSGKYADGARPANARISLYSRFTRYTNPQAEAACARYVALAREHGMEPAQMALAYVTSRPFVTSNIIGATSLEQLETNLGSVDLRLDESARRYRCNPPGATRPGSLSLQGPGAAAGSADNRAMRSSAPPGDQARLTGPAR